MNRNLDGVYFRVKREGVYESICFSDLTEPEMNEILTDRPETWLKGLCKILAATLREIGGQFDIQGGISDDD